MTLLVALPLLVPLTVAALSFAAWRRARLQAWLSVAGAVAHLASAVALVLAVREHGVLALRAGGWPAPFGVTLVADGLGALMALLAAIGGLWARRPLLAALFLVPALSLAGVPPLSGFHAKLLLVQAGLAEGRWVAAAVALAVSFGRGRRARIRRTGTALRFLAFFAKEVVVSALRVAQATLRRDPGLRPAIVGVPLDVRTDGQITALPILITLTPGTLALDVTPDRRTLLVHAMFAADAEGVRRDVKEGFERRILELAA